MKKVIIPLTAILFSFKIYGQPVISSFTPGSGNVGTSVTIKGTGFNTTAANNIVYFGAVKATVSAATDTTLAVAVPVGATYQPITVTTNNLTAYSVNSFIVTFAGSSGLFNSTSFLPKVDYTAGIYPHSDAITDFDGDGKSDVLVSRGSSANVSVFPNTSTSGSISFGTKLDFAATGNSHEGCATGDIDGDGKKDFVITNSYNPYSISVYRNTSSVGAISFAPKIDFAADNAPYSVAIGDLDGDGKPDIAIANNGSNLINVYKNTSTPGNISFAPRIDFTVGTNPYSVAIGDIDGDGKPDMAITTQGSSSALSVMKNTSANGVISFNSPVNYASLAGSFTVTIGDLNGDNKPEVVAVASSTGVVVMTNSSSPGNISFSLTQGFTAGNYPVCVAISDLNGDGKPDLVTSNRYSNNVSALKNTSTGLNISFASHEDYAVNTDPFYVAAGDLDGDSRPDLVAANSATPYISVLANLIGTNVAPVITSFTPTSGITGTSVTILGSGFTAASSVKFGGVDASSFTVDSATGITAIVGNGASGNVSVTTNYGTATSPGFIFNGPLITSFNPMVGVTGTVVTISGSNFTGATSVKFGGTNAASFTVNSSTSITATVGSGSSGSVSVTTPNGTASLAGFIFGPPTITSFSPLSATVGSVVTITGTNFSTTAVNNVVYFGAVKATISAATSTQLSVVVPAGATYQPITVTTGNLTAYSAKPFFVIFPNDNPQITSASFSVVNSYGTGAYPVDVKICDMNNDNLPDLITANSTSNNISILKNTSSNGNISFSPKIDFGTGPDPKRIAIGDLDGDGLPDLAISSFNAGNASVISVFRNTTSGGSVSLSPKVDYATGNGTVSVFITDINIDGKPDIIAPSGNSGYFSVFINTSTTAGSISFATRQDFSLFFHPDNITMADLDGDGKPDLVTSNFSANNISIIRNTSNGGILSFDTRIDYAVGSNPTQLATGDFDGDGKLDIVVSNYGSNSFTFLKNNSTPGIIQFASNQTLNLNTTNFSVSDLNGDGKLDLYIGRWLSGITSILQNTYSTGPNFSFASNIDFTTGTYDTNVSSGDLDGDGKPELASANTTQYTVTVLKNRIAEPQITSLSSLTGGSGSTITINGNNFSGTNAVKFGGTPANSFTIVSPTRVDAVVGGGASGNVTVTTALGTGSITGFNFIPAVTTAGTTTVCNGEFVLLNSTAAANNQWYKNAVAISGATSTTYQATSSGVYTVSTTSNGITTTSPTGVTVTVITTAAPTISLIGNNLSSSVVSGNQWYFNGTIIPGATAQTYQPTQTGNYTVTATANGCTSQPSAAYNFVVTGLINPGTNQFIKLFPNPVRKDISITWNINNISTLNIIISDIQGREVMRKNNIHTGAAIDLRLLAQGVYAIRIYDDHFKVNEMALIIRKD